MSQRAQTLAWAAQRLSGMVLGLFVVVHLLTIIYAVRNGLSGAEILGRTRGNLAWAAFYALFVAALAVHAPIGLRAILSEWASWRGRSLDVAIIAIGIVLALLGFRAVWSVFK